MTSSAALNLREYIGCNSGYHTINREERNLAAIFYHVLLLENNLERFKQLINCPFPTVEEQMGIYFEYAHLRDLWHIIDKGDKKKTNDFKRQLILDFLEPRNRTHLETVSIRTFNDFFGSATGSDEYIASPATWSMPSYHENFEQEEFLKVCRFKWSFNAKPDIVIHTSYDTAICIEAKLESGEGKYPSLPNEINIFAKKGLKERVGQRSIQENIMGRLLNVKTDFIYLVKKKRPGDDCKVITWKEVFNVMDTGTCPPFIKKWIHRVQGL